MGTQINKNQLPGWYRKYVEGVGDVVSGVTGTQPVDNKVGGGISYNKPNMSPLDQATIQQSQSPYVAPNVTPTTNNNLSIAGGYDTPVTPTITPPVTPPVTPLDPNRTNAQGLTMEQANDPKYWDNGTYTGQVAETPQIRDIAGYVPEENTAMNEAQQRYAELINQQPMTEDQIRNAVTNRFQSQIDATNRYYADVLARENTAGEGRLGETASIQARRGLLGSDFGAAQTAGTRSSNANVISSIENQRNAEMQSILTQGRKNVVEEEAAKVAASKLGAQEYIAFLAGESKRKEDRVTQTLSNLVNSTTEPTGEEIEELSKILRVSKEELMSKYNQAKKTASTDKKLTVVSAGSSIYDESGNFLGTAPSDDVNDLKSLAPGASLYDKDGNIIVTAPERASDTSSKIVKIGGVDYEEVIGPDGTKTYKIPEVPALTPEASAYQSEKAARTIQSVDGLLKDAKDNAGIFGRTAGMPIADWMRSDAYRNFQADLKTLKASIAFGELTAMREASKTGGALGQVSEKELALLESALGSMEMNQTPENIVKNLEQIKSSVSEWQKALSGQGASVDKASMWNDNVSDVSYQEAVSKYGQEKVDAMMRDFKSEEQTSLKGTTAKVAKVEDNTKGGQCGHFVNEFTGLGVGNTYESKMNKMDPSIKTPQPGMVFVMPYSWTGHTGFILDVKDGVATVKDSNWFTTSAPETVRTHEIPVSKMTGFRMV